MIDTKELRKLTQAATPGPWWVNQDGLNHGFPRGVLEINANDWHALAGAWAINGAKPSEEGAANAAFIAAANPAAISELLDRLEAAEKERDNYKSAYKQWDERTEWVQHGVTNGTSPSKYLGWHRADVVADLLNAAEKERNALRAKISDLRINVEYLGNLKRSYEELIGELQEDRDELRAKIEAMEKQKPVASIYISGNGTRELDDWRSDLPTGPNMLYALPGAQGEEK